MDVRPGGAAVGAPPLGGPAGWADHLDVELLDVTHTDAGTIRVSIGHEDGVLGVEGTYDEIATLCDVLEQVAALATISASEDSWLDDVPVGVDVVKLGIRAGGRVRLSIVPARRAA